MLGCADVFRVFVLPRAMPDLVLAADSFHTNPLRRFLQSVDRYQVLSLSRDRARLLEGNRDGLVEIDLAEPVPRTSADALGDELTEPQQTVFPHGGIGRGSSPMVHSSGGKKDESDLDAERYFRALDRALLEHHSRPSGLPLMLAALPEHHHRFRQVSHNSLLLPDGLETNPEALDMATLSQRAWAVVQPQYQARQQAWGDAFQAALASGRGSDDLNAVAQAAVEGRVASLLIEDERQVAGRLDSSTGRVSLAERSAPAVDDLLDDIGELVEQMGGEVRLIPAQRMPTKTGVAATFRH